MNVTTRYTIRSTKALKFSFASRDTPKDKRPLQFFVLKPYKLLILRNAIPINADFFLLVEFGDKKLKII